MKIGTNSSSMISNASARSSVWISQSAYASLWRWYPPEVLHLVLRFASQGDGACFEGSYSYRKGASRAIRAYAPRDQRLAAIADQLQQTQRRNLYALEARVTHRGRYYDEYSVEISVERNSDRFQPPTADAEDCVSEALRDLARWLYRQLEQEYDHQTSNEVVDEGIIANGYTFTRRERGLGSYQNL